MPEKTKKDILIIEDDKELSMITSDMLEDYGYEIGICHTAEDAYDFLTEHSVRLIILDINLPGDSGFDFCQELRRSSTVPVIFVSARTSETDRITGLDLGADDYLAKPYSLQELLSRIKANMRRAYGFGKEDRIMKFGNVTVRTSSRKVEKEGVNVNLSLKEYDILLYLLEHSNQVVSKENIITGVWGAMAQIEDSSLAVHIRWLREKLEDNPGKPEFIKTVWGIGYKFENEEEK